MWEISWNTSNLLSNINAGIGKSWEWDTMCMNADDEDRQVAVDDVMRKLHKMITQINHTN